ncbi:MAG: hypothetical protein GX213_11680 [Clostridiaceae bacterium]|nr:hypothetical protein [Clostridiaceae bacterium]
MRTKTLQLNKIFLVITVITGVVITCGVFAFANNEADITITIECFYFNACASCNEETKLLQQFQDLIGETQSHVKIIYRMHNTFHANETEILKQYYEKYNIPGNERYMPILFIGDTYLPGEDEIKAGLKQAVNEQMQKNGMDTPDLSWQVAGDKQKKYTVTYTKTNDTELIYFYLPSCGDCEKVEKVLDRLPGSVKLEQGNELINSKIKIIKLNAGEEDNLDILKARFEYLNVPVEEQQVPIVFLGDTWISGASNIQSKLENAILSGHGIGTVQVLTTGESKPSDAGVLNLLSVFLTGLVNGLSPCSLSMLILFFSLLISNEKVKLLGAGITFIAGKFLAFILLGTLLYRFFVNAEFSLVSNSVKSHSCLCGFCFYHFKHT